MNDLEYEHYLEILKEVRAARLAAERRFRVPGCGYDCEDGFHEIAFNEYGPLDAIPEDDPAVIVYPHGLILFACECNSAGGRVRRGLGWAT